MGFHRMEISKLLWPWTLVAMSITPFVAFCIILASCAPSSKPVSPKMNRHSSIVQRRNAAQFIWQNILKDKGGWLGVEVMEVTPPVASTLGLGANDVYKGVMVAKVTENSPAQAAGFRKGDIIMQANQRKLAVSQELVNVVRSHAPGDEIGFIVKRGGTVSFMKAVLGKWPKELVTSQQHASAAVSHPETPRLQQNPEIVIHQVAIKPARVPPKAEFDLEVHYSVNDPRAGDDKIKVNFTYKILAGSKSVFTSKPVVLDTPNGQKCIRTNHLKKKKKKGNYSIQVTIQYKEDLVTKVAQFVIE